MIIKPRNWNEFQHYKDRSPSWIKLHKNLLDNYEFQMLPIDSKALAPMLWLLASDFKDAEINLSNEAIAFRLRMSVKDYIKAVTPLINSSFFECLQDDSTPLANGLPREEKEKRKRREEKERECSFFDDFWKLYPKGHKKSKKVALAKWKTLNLDKKADIILKHVKECIAKDDRWRNGYIPDATVYINQERWDGDIYKDKTSNKPQEDTAPRLNYL